MQLTLRHFAYEHLLLFTSINQSVSQSINQQISKVA